MAVFLLGAHALSFLAAWLNSLDIGIRLLLSLGVLTSLWLTLRRNRTGSEIRGLAPKPDGSWRLYIKNGAEIEARLMPGSLSSPWTVLLHFLAEDESLNHEAGIAPETFSLSEWINKSKISFRVPQGHYSVLICRDSLAPDAFRRLRVALRVAGMRDSRPGGFS